MDGSLPSAGAGAPRDAPTSAEVRRAITVASPAVYRRQIGHLILANGGAALAAVGAVVWTVIHGVEWQALMVAAIFYGLTGVGVEIGLHRGCAHGAFECPKWLRLTLVAFGAMAAQGPPAYWVANHRRHHVHADREGDPHSPRRGLWHAHMGWLLDREVTLTPRFAPDLLKEPGVRWIDRHYGPIVLVGVLAPGLLCGLATWSLAGVVSGVLWGGGVRLFLVQHGTFFINSGCHYLGVRPFLTRDLSSNVAPMVWATFGQSLHNTHHAFPDSATTALLAGDIDPGGKILWALARVGLVRNLKLPSRTAVIEKLVNAADAERVRMPRLPGL